MYHESLILCLELICTTYNSSFVDPSFIPTLRTQGWRAVARRFQSSTSNLDLDFPPDRPALNHPSIAIPVHVNGDHWTAFCRRIINGVTYFYYADDMNIPTIQLSIKRLIMKNTDPEFCPPNSIWVNCTTPKFRPHSNECGPRTMLALAIMITHPVPHKNMLHPYISTNLAQNSQHWMSITLLTGMLMLLPPTQEEALMTTPNYIESQPLP